MIQIADKEFVPFLTTSTIDKRIEELANTINQDYDGQAVTFLVVLNGAFMFASDLIKKVKLACQVSFIKVKSYEGIESKGNVTEIFGITDSLENENVIIVEDIVDSGLTIETLYKALEREKCNSVKVATLLFKPDAFRGNICPCYVGFEIENKFVVGYGLDYNEKGRNLDAIYQLKK